MHAEVGAATLLALPAAALTPEAEAATGEHLGEEVLHVREDVRSVTAPARAALEPGVAELVVNLPLLRVGEDLVGLVAGLELGLRLRIALVPVRVVLQRFALVSLPEVLAARGSLDSEDLVVIALFRHRWRTVEVSRRTKGPPAPAKAKAGGRRVNGS